MKRLHTKREIIFVFLVMVIVSALAFYFGGRMIIEITEDSATGVDPVKALAAALIMTTIGVGIYLKRKLVSRKKN